MWPWQKYRYLQDQIDTLEKKLKCQQREIADLKMNRYIILSNNYAQCHFLPTQRKQKLVPNVLEYCTSHNASRKYTAFELIEALAEHVGCEFKHVKGTSAHLTTENEIDIDRLSKM